MRRFFFSQFVVVGATGNHRGDRSARGLQRRHGLQSQPRPPLGAQRIERRARLAAPAAPADAMAGPPGSCVPSESSSPVANSCGVFVSSVHGSDATGKGTQAAPYKTIGKALAEGSTVYACAGAAPYTEALSIEDKPAKLYGALDCATWGYDAATKTQITALRGRGAAYAREHGRRDRGPRLRDHGRGRCDGGGGSSIAVLDDGADLTLDRVDVAAGAGKGGATGTAAESSATPTTREREATGTDDPTCNNAGPISGGQWRQEHVRHARRPAAASGAIAPPRPIGGDGSQRAAR